MNKNKELYSLNYGFSDMVANGLIFSIFKKDIAKLKIFLDEKGLDSHEKDSGGNSIFFWATESRDLNIIKLLNDYDLFSIYTDEVIAKSVRSSISRGDELIWSWWCEEFSHIYAQFKWSYLRTACSTYNLKFIAKFLNDDIEFDINEQDKLDGNTLLHISAEKMYDNIFEILLNAGSALEIKNKANQTPRDILDSKSGLVKSEKKARDRIYQMIDCLKV
jgi:ankyrin repeat protein